MKKGKGERKRFLDFNEETCCSERTEFNKLQIWQFPSHIHFLFLNPGSVQNIRSLTLFARPLAPVAGKPVAESGNGFHTAGSPIIHGFAAKETKSQL